MEFAGIRWTTSLLCDERTATTFLRKPSASRFSAALIPRLLRSLRTGRTTRSLESSHNPPVAIGQPFSPTSKASGMRSHPLGDQHQTLNVVLLHGVTTPAEMDALGQNGSGA